MSRECSNPQDLLGEDFDYTKRDFQILLTELNNNFFCYSYNDMKNFIKASLENNNILQTGLHLITNN